MIPQELRKIKFRKIKYDIKTHYEELSVISKEMHDLEMENRFEQAITETLTRFKKIDASYTMRSKEKEPYEKELKLLIKQIRNEIKSGNLSYSGGIEQLNRVFDACSKKIMPYVNAGIQRLRAEAELQREFSDWQEIEKKRARRLMGNGLGYLVHSDYDHRAPPKANRFVKFLIIHEKDRRPISGINLCVTAPKLSSEKALIRSKSDDSGWVTVDKIKYGDVGISHQIKQKSLSSTLKFIRISEEIPPDNVLKNPIRNHPWTDLLDIIEHPVSSDQSLNSIVKKFSVPMNDFLLFNWQTTEINKINSLMSLTVGCHQWTSDGSFYQFSNEDDPGVVFAPLPLKLTNLSSDSTYVIEVKPVGYMSPRALRHCS